MGQPVISANPKEVKLTLNISDNVTDNVRDHVNDIITIPETSKQSYQSAAGISEPGSRVGSTTTQLANVGDRAQSTLSAADIDEIAQRLSLRSPLPVVPPIVHRENRNISASITQ